MDYIFIFFILYHLIILMYRDESFREFFYFLTYYTFINNFLKLFSYSQSLVFHTSILSCSCKKLNAYNIELDFFHFFISYQFFSNWHSYHYHRSDSLTYNIHMFYFKYFSISWSNIAKNICRFNKCTTNDPREIYKAYV